MADRLRRHAPRQALLIGAGAERAEHLALPGVQLVPIGTASPLRCELAALPFADRQFSLVIVRAGIDDPQGDVLDECLRVVRGGGRMLVLAEGRWRLGRGHGERVQPLRVGALLRQLEARSFRIEERSGRGIAGWGLSTGAGWARPLLSVSDQVVVCAQRHEGGAVIRPMKFAAPSTVGGRAAALDGVNREAVA